MATIYKQSRTTTIRKTAKYELYQGYDQTANLYTILRLRFGPFDTFASCKSWLPEMEKNRLENLSDEDFDTECSKYDYL